MSGSNAEGEERAGSRRCPQVQVNEYKENGSSAYTSLRPIQTTTSGETAKVYLSPFSLSNSKLSLFKLSRSPAGNNSNNAVACKKADRKTICRRALTSKMKAVPSKAEPVLLKPSLDAYTDSTKLEPKSTEESVAVSVDMGSSDEDGAPNLDGFPGLSPYERKRLKNIRENANFFASLQLSESAARLRGMIKKSQPTESKRKRPKKKENEIGCRRSMRLLKVDPLGVPLPAVPAPPTLEEENPLLPPGPLEMVPENQDDSNELFKASLRTWAEMSKASKERTREGLSSIKSYKASLSGMVISEATVRKVTAGAVSSVALHPSEVRTLVAAGAKSGQIGLWDLTRDCEDQIYVFYAHSQPVSCLYFSPTNPAHLLSLSYDGTLRCGDFSSGIFEEVYRNEGSSPSSFDFLAEDASTLLMGHWDGHLSLVDRRTPGTSYEKFFNSSLGKIRTVHVHPVSRQYFITAGLRDVHVYDARHLNAKRSQPLISLTEHSKSIASAYFSPVTGNRVVTTCADCKLRVFDSSSISSQIPLLTTIRHNTITGRWLTRFQAVWDPKQEDCFIVGSMAHPRRVEVFHETGKNVYSFFGDCLVSVCSLSVMHPTRYVLAGGNSSGRLHVFMHPESC
ncbi:WD repeat-containing protein 76 isoform X2 [Onychomys torridus]|uniref:WD repeat-containing protein 76 isoform X2 n=1 Tax=Onychomys torridus TaxID=38674 RepID=UPI00167FA42A|nr:WD repeat-containing protein 76 isoform X2 [Onychomys torridus]